MEWESVRFFVGTTPLTRQIAPAQTPLTRQIAPAQTPLTRQIAPAQTPLTWQIAPAQTPMHEDKAPFSNESTRYIECYTTWYNSHYTLIVVLWWYLNSVNPNVFIGTIHSISNVSSLCTFHCNLVIAVIIAININ